MYFKGDLINPYTIATEDMVAIAAKLNLGAWAILVEFVSRNFWLDGDFEQRTKRIRGCSGQTTVFDCNVVGEMERMIEPYPDVPS